MSIPESEFLENLETDFETLDNGLFAREPRDKIVNRQQRIEIQHLATLTPFDYEKCRKIKAKKMGVRIDTLDKRFTRHAGKRRQRRTYQRRSALPQAVVVAVAPKSAIIVKPDVALSEFR